ncbi:MAG: elongation factor P [Eubacteriales bacterium]|jgi:elongation factor P|nr:elongation factor P [Eubacteriales bacterium]
MISAGEFRNGVSFEMDGQVFQVVEFQHVKPGKGSAFVRTKYRNVKTGSVVERTFNPNEKFERAQLDRDDMTYLYRDGDLHYFMNTETYEQFPISSEILGDTLKFLKENMDCKVLSYKGEIFSIEPPTFVELEVIECEPGVKGDTATNVMKNAVVETGAIVKVPLFIGQGERIRIDTRSGEYMERA